MENYKSPKSVRDRNREAYHAKKFTELKGAPVLELPATTKQSALVIRFKNMHTDLSSEINNWKRAHKMLHFLIDFCPSGIFHSLYEQMKEYFGE